MYSLVLSHLSSCENEEFLEEGGHSDKSGINIVRFRGGSTKHISSLVPQFSLNTWKDNREYAQWRLIYNYLFLLSTLGIKLRALYMLDKCSMAEQHSCPEMYFVILI